MEFSLIDVYRNRTPHVDIFLHKPGEEIFLVFALFPWRLRPYRVSVNNSQSSMAHLQMSKVQSTFMPQSPGGQEICKDYANNHEFFDCFKCHFVEQLLNDTDIKPCWAPWLSNFMDQNDFKSCETLEDAIKVRSKGIQIVSEYLTVTDK